MVHPYHDILLINKKEWNIDMHNLDEAQGPMSEWKKAISKDHRLYGSIYITYPDDQITHKDGKWISVCMSTDIGEEQGKCYYTRVTEIFMVGE